MRRLTPEEQVIVNDIIEKKIIRFEDLVKPYLTNNPYYFKISKLKNEELHKVITSTEDELEEYRVYTFLKDYKIMNSEAKKVFLQRVFSKFNLIMNIEKLLRLLEANGYLNIFEHDVEVDKNKIYFIGEQPKEETINDYFNAGFKSKQQAIKLIKILNSTFSPTPALELYKKDSFRTEEQKVNDDNRETGTKTLKAAVAGLIATAFFSILSFIYTVKTYNHTIEKDEADSIAEARKDSLDDFYRNELMLNLDRVVEGLSKKEPVPVEMKKVAETSTTPSK